MILLDSILFLQSGVFFFKNHNCFLTMGGCESKAPPPKVGPSRRPELGELAKLPECSVSDEIIGLHVTHGGPANGCQILLYIARALRTHSVGDSLKLKYLKSEDGELMDDAVKIMTYCGYAIVDVHSMKRIYEKFNEVGVTLQHIDAVAGVEVLEVL